MIGRLMTGSLVGLVSMTLLAGSSAGFAGGTPALAQASRAGAGKTDNSDDVKFAKTTFTKLANGDQGVARDIDWENFKVSSQDVGAKYKPFHDEANRGAFRKAFISSFSKSFKRTGARAESLKNWKVKTKEANQTIVSGETLSKSHLLITVSKRGGAKKMSGIENGP